MRNKVYSATAISHVQVERIGQGRAGVAAVAGCDVGKRELFVVVRWADGGFERPWVARNPSDVPVLVAALARRGAGRRLGGAGESTGAGAARRRGAGWG